MKNPLIAVTHEEGRTTSEQPQQQYKELLLRFGAWEKLE